MTPSSHVDDVRFGLTAEGGSEPAFFRHHGVMAPGIRAFRRIGFPAKAAWVSLAFLMPIVVLSVSLWYTASQSIAFSAKERLGVEYVEALIPLLDAAQNRRRAAAGKAPDLAAASEKVDRAFESVRAVHARLGASLGLDGALTSIAKLQAELNAKPLRDDSESTFAAHTAFVDAALRLVNDVADRSNLTLDPEVDTFYLMEAAVLKQPLLIEQLGRLRGMGNVVLRAGEKSEAQHDVLTTAHAFGTAYQLGVAASLQRAIASDGSIASKIDTSEAVRKSEALLDAVKKQLLTQAPSGDAGTFVKVANEAIAAHYQALGRTLEELDRRLEERVNELERLLFLQLGIALVGIFVAIYLLVAFYRVTQGGIAEVARQLECMAKGDLTPRPQPWGRDEVARLMVTLGSTLVVLRNIVGEIRSSSAEIETASHEVAAASSDLSRRTEEAASQLQLTSSAMAKIGGTVRQTTEIANGTARLVTANTEVAVHGGLEVASAVSTMQTIRESSGRIEEIIGTINGIAFQTNILALNAAVEAARAGEQGRGFAVVAGEVRALAQRSAGAAQEIKHLIGQSVTHVSAGADVIGRAGQTMERIVSQAAAVQEQMAHIARDAQAQTDGLAAIGRSVEQLDGMTRQNAALVEETAAAAASLKDSAHRMNTAMRFFQTT